MSLQNSGNRPNYPNSQMKMPENMDLINNLLQMCVGVVSAATATSSAEKNNKNTQNGESVHEDNRPINDRENKMSEASRLKLVGMSTKTSLEADEFGISGLLNFKSKAKRVENNFKSTAIQSRRPQPIRRLLAFLLSPLVNLFNFMVVTFCPFNLKNPRVFINFNMEIQNGTSQQMEDITVSLNFWPIDNKILIVVENRKAEEPQGMDKKMDKKMGLSAATIVKISADEEGQNWYKMEMVELSSDGKATESSRTNLEILKFLCESVRNSLESVKKDLKMEDFLKLAVETIYRKMLGQNVVDQFNQMIGQTNGDLIKTLGLQGEKLEKIEEKEAFQI